MKHKKNRLLTGARLRVKREKKSKISESRESQEDEETVESDRVTVGPLRVGVQGILLEVVTN